MNKKFLVVKGKVKYPTWCEDGLYLKQVDGSIEYPVDNYLGKDLISKIGQTIEENIDFEVIQRTMNGNRSALLCNKGEVAGGNLKYNKWYITLIAEDDKGKQKSYPANELTPVQFAQRVESAEYLEDIKWRNMEKDFSRASKNLKSAKQITEWFRNNINK